MRPIPLKPKLPDKILNMRNHKPITKPVLSKPALRSDGTCSACLGGNLCRFCQEEGLKRDRELSRVLARAVVGIRETRIARVCSRFELESDEFLTREQKAQQMLEANPHLA